MLAHDTWRRVAYVALCRLPKFRMTISVRDIHWVLRAFDNKENVMVLAPRRNLVALAVASLLISPSAPDLLCAQQEKPGRVWKVKESSTRLWIADGMLVSASTQDVRETISLSAIKALAYETTGEHPAAGEIGAWVKDLWDAAPDAGEAGGFIIFPMVAGAAIPSLFLPLKKTRHLIYIDWERAGKEEKRVYLLSKSEALSLLNELRRSTGLQCTNSGQVRCSNWVAIEKSSVEGNDSVGHNERGRLVAVDRGHGFSTLEMVPIQLTPVDCRPASNDFEAMLAEARHKLEEVGQEKERQQTPPSQEASKPRLHIPSGQLGTKVILAEMTCRAPASESSSEKK
jgi:hypothetical protein